MLYKVLDAHDILIAAGHSDEIDTADGKILLPISATQLYIYWLSPTGNIVSSLTLRQPIRVQGLIKLTNGSDQSARLKIIDIS
jgi:hypothetical protein